MTNRFYLVTTLIVQDDNGLRTTSVSTSNVECKYANDAVKIVEDNIKCELDDYIDIKSIVVDYGELGCIEEYIRSLSDKEIEEIRADNN